MDNFWKAGPLKFGRAKKRPKFIAIFDNFRLWSWISPERLQISKFGKKCDRQRYPPAFHEKSPVNFDPQTKKFYWLTLSHPTGFFGGDYISALRGCCRLKFVHAPEIDQDYLAHTPTGTGVTPKNFDRENLKFGLKFSVLATITSGLVWVSPQNIFHTTCRETGVITFV